MVQQKLVIALQSCYYDCTALKENGWSNCLYWLYCIMQNLRVKYRLSPYFFATRGQPLLPMDLALHDLKVPAAEDFLKDTKKLWSTIYQRDSHQAIKDKSRANKARRQSTIQSRRLSNDKLHATQCSKLSLESSNQDFQDYSKWRPKWEPMPLDLPCQPQCEFTQYSTSHFYDFIKKTINLQDLLKQKQKLNMKLRGLCATVAMGEDGNTLYNSLVMMLIKIVGYRQMNYRILQLFLLIISPPKA